MMCPAVFPGIKLHFFDTQWPLQEARAARELLHDEVCASLTWFTSILTY
jgi:hypothetical protein